MSNRAGYTVVVYALDVSSSMAEPKADPAGSGVKRPKLTWAKEYIARMCEPKIQSGRKTEHVGLVAFGGRTNNQANNAWVAEHPGDEEPPYTAVSSEVAIQTAKPKMLEVLMNLEGGQEEGNPVSALVVALDMIQMHKHSKAWTLEIVLLTDGESAFDQSEFEEAMEKLDELGIKLSVVGIDFQDPDLPVEKSKSRNKRLSEKFWRTFVKQLHERISQTTEFDKFLPEISVFDQLLIQAREPHPAVINGTVSQTNLYIGAGGYDADQAIDFPIRWSKATMKARPPSLSKAWRAAVEMQQPATMQRGTEASQLMSQLQSQHQSQQQQGPNDAPVASDLAAMISSDVKQYTTYVIKHKPDVPATQRAEGDEDIPTIEQVQEEDEEPVDKEDLVKAWRFGSSWVPMEGDTFEPLHTQKGVEVLGFVPQANIRHFMLIGEVRYLWPDMTSPKAQIQFSSFVSALVTTQLVAITRWVNKDDAEPHIGVCIPKQDFPDVDRKLDLMYWVKLPFADDHHAFWFPSLTKYKTASGKAVTEHPFIPTEEQCDLMDELVKGMDLDSVGKKRQTSSSDDEEDEEMEEEPSGTWFDPALSFNPVIHRIKEAIFHASLTADRKADPLPPPHPAITRYFHTPPEIAERVEKVTEQLKDSLDIKKVPPKTRKRVNKEGLREDEGFIDIDELFDEPDSNAQLNTRVADSKAKAVVSSPGKKVEVSDTKPDIADDPDFLPMQRPKPKIGRLISNERPLEDFDAVVQGEGDLFRKAIQDLGAVVKENVAASFSRSAFPLAIKCLEAARSTALMYEESETYNDVVDDLEQTVKKAGFKHPDFWDQFTKAGANVARITPEEARQAIEEDYDE